VSGTTVLCDLPIDRLATTDLLDTVFGGLATGIGGWVVTVNLDILRRAAVDVDARALYGEADVRVADGMPIVWASRLQGRPVPERVTGSGSAWLLAERAAREGRSLYLLGGAPGAAAAARDVLVERYPGLDVLGVSSPVVASSPTAAELDPIAEELAACRPDLVLVGLGSPKQELVIRALRHRLPGAWFVGVGITFSFVGGLDRRAPVWMQRAGLEWLHRLGREPRRLARRYLVDDLPFAARLLVAAAASRRLT
jgi:N-acetylglucosaminyldiphosphoundecaprenol N-acetyl-beta-D-mannosaminyltransferase